MPFQMGFSRESLSGKPPVPAGMYKLRLTGFKLALSKAGDSVNYNPQFEIIDNPEYDGRKVFETMNSKGAWVLQDMSHACGQLLVELQDGNQGTEAATFVLPGIWANADVYPDDPSKWEYTGPLTNATLEAELYEHEYNGKKSNKVKQFICKVPGCTVKHSTNLAG